MGSQLVSPDEVTFDQVFTLAQRLRPLDQMRLLVRLAPKVESILEQVEPATASSVRTQLRGLLADLGPAPSAEEIDAVQHEMWGSFAQE